MASKKKQQRSAEWYRRKFKAMERALIKREAWYDREEEKTANNGEHVKSALARAAACSLFHAQMWIKENVWEKE